MTGIFHAPAADAVLAPLPRVTRPGIGSERQASRSARSIQWILISSLFVVTPCFADRIVGTNDSDNNSFSFFPVWRSQLNGTNGDDYIYGLRGNDLLYGRTGNDYLSGNQDDDQLYGESGNDELSGGVDGRDLLWGGTGNDLYFIGDSLDSVRESSGQGVDSVISFVNYTLPANVENLFLQPETVWGGVDYEPGVKFDTDCASYSGGYPCRQLGYLAVGNGLNNEIRGNPMANLVCGFGGDDVLFGLDGDDTLSGGSGNDFLAGFSIDHLWYSSEIDTLTGGAGADVFVIGLSGRSGGLSVSDDIFAWEDFPQYLGQGMVYIMDFQWREGDKIEVFGNFADYWVELDSNRELGAHAKILWNGTAYGYGAREVVGYVKGITRLDQLIPAYDFL